MSNPTTPFSWQMPTATDLVTDLPADFEVFGQAVATSMADLLGGTTGQILAKNSATDMDFVWIANDQGDITGITAGNGITVTSPTGPVPTVAINTAVTADLTTAQTLTNKTLTSPALTTPTISTLTTNGDLLYGTGSGALARKAIGTTGQVLTVAGGIPSWATPASGSTFSGVSVSNTTDLSTSNNTYATITFNTELYDTDSYHSTVTNASRITIPTGKTGYFLVAIVGLFEGTNATGTRDLAIAKNGTRVFANVTNKATGSNQTLQAANVMYLTAGDYLEFQVRQSSGTTVPWYGTGSSDGTSYTVSYLGA